MKGAIFNFFIACPRVKKKEFTLDCFHSAWLCFYMHKMSGDERKLEFCLSENKGADQLCSNCTADQRLCFR